MKKVYQIVLTLTIPLFLIIAGCCRDKSGKDSFRFAFLTDIHIAPERSAPEGFRTAIEKVNDLKPDFVITGGDLIMDALGQRFGRADTLYNMYAEALKGFRMPVYNAMGNHEIYGIYRTRSGADSLHPEYGEKMFDKRLGKSFYTFDHKGWRFFIINSIEDTGKERYIGMVDAGQIQWIREELQKTDTLMPLVICTHIPFITANTQRYEGSTAATDSGMVIVNSKEVLDLFSRHNLKLVLQGHLHTVEDIFIDGIRFVTAGAVSGGWWKGPYRNFEEGFMLITACKNDIKWEYVDYGWTIKK